MEVNQGFETVFSYSNDEITGKSLETLNVGLTKQNIKPILEKSEFEGIIPHNEINLVKQTGVPFIADVAISRIDINSEPCLLIEIHDIDEILRAKKAVTEVNHKLKILSSITRHDILNRVMVTSMYSDLLKEGVTDETMNMRLNAIRQSSDEIQSLIEFTGQYQDLGAVAPDWQIVENILKRRSIQGLLHGVTLHTQLGGLEIYADQMIEKVMYNLVENSVRHGQGLTSIRLSCHEESGDMNLLYEDDGGGIAADEKEKAFEKGFGKNTGLGLFLIREILSITEISINETGEPGVGVRFEIRVPAGKYRMNANAIGG